jgi:hypothetical protein
MTATDRSSLLGWARRPFRLLGRDVRELHRIEHEGENAATPFIAGAGLLLLAIAIFFTIVGVSFGAYYLAR